VIKIDKVESTLYPGTERTAYTVKYDVDNTKEDLEEEEIRHVLRDGSPLITYMYAVMSQSSRPTRARSRQPAASQSPSSVWMALTPSAFCPPPHPTFPHYTSVTGTPAR